MPELAVSLGTLRYKRGSACPLGQEAVREGPWWEPGGSAPRRCSGTEGLGGPTLDPGGLWGWGAGFCRPASPRPTLHGHGHGAHRDWDSARGVRTDRAGARWRLGGTVAPWEPRESIRRVRARVAAVRAASQGRPVRRAAGKVCRGVGGGWGGVVSVRRPPPPRPEAGQVWAGRPDPAEPGPGAPAGNRKRGGGARPEGREAGRAGGRAGGWRAGRSGPGRGGDVGGPGQPRRPRGRGRGPGRRGRRPPAPAEPPPERGAGSPRRLRHAG